MLSSKRVCQDSWIRGFISSAHRLVDDVANVKAGLPVRVERMNLQIGHALATLTDSIQRRAVVEGFLLLANTGHLGNFAKARDELFGRFPNRVISDLVVIIAKSSCCKTTDAILVT